jgi:hypothetical protein
VAFPCCLLHLPCPRPFVSRFQPADPSVQPPVQHIRVLKQAGIDGMSLEGLSQLQAGSFSFGFVFEGCAKTKHLAALSWVCFVNPDQI